MRTLPYFVGVVLVVALLVVLNLRLGMQQEVFFTAALQHAGIAIPPGTTLSGKELLYAQTLAAQNPLLALPGTNVDSLEIAVAQLPEVENSIYALDASSTNAKLLQSLYPIVFLQAAAKLEGARQAFVLNGTKANEAAYIDAAGKAFASYQSNASTFAKAFTMAIPPSSGKFATNGDIVSRADILAAVATLKKNIMHTADVFADRAECTRGLLQKCSAQDLLVPDITVTPPAPITPQQLAQAKSVRALYAVAHGQPAINTGPMLLLSSTECASNMADGAPLFSFYTPALSSSTFPVYIGNIRFDTTVATSSASFLRFSGAMHKQITYILDSPILHYTCLESGHDAGALFAMQDTYAFAQTQKLSQYATSSNTQSALAALESKNITVLTQNQVEAYLHAATTLTLPAAVKQQLTTLSLSYLLTSAHFEASVSELVGDEESNAALVNLGWPIEISVPYMFFIRSSFTMLSLANSSASIQMGGSQKLFPPNTIAANRQPYVYYSDLPHTPAILQTLIHDIHFFYIIHTDSSLVSSLPKS